MSTIAEQNDAFRCGIAPGTVFLTAGVNALPVEAKLDILKKVIAFDAFTEDNDPYGEHDFGSFSLGEQTIFWKIDYYARDMKHGSPNPADPAVTTRVLTVMFAEEY
jgi:hypothetical protein